MVILVVKIVSAIVYPAGMAFFLIATGMGLWRWARSDRWQRRGRWLAVIGLAAFYLFSNGLVAEQLALSLERRVMAPDPMPHADGVIVLGGGISPRAYPRQTAEVHDAGDRLLYGAHLIREGLADWMVCAGGGGELSVIQQTEAEAMQEMLAWMGVAEEQITLDTKSRNTRENAAESLPLAMQRGARSVYLVTSASHMPRSLGIYRKQAEQLGITDLEIIPAPCDYIAIDPEKDQPWYYRMAMSLLPNAWSLRTSTQILHEYYGMAYYRLRGWI
ncbi:MAG: YdcF family protein [Pirellulales bacterium]